MSIKMNKAEEILSRKIVSPVFLSCIRHSKNDLYLRFAAALKATKIMSLMLHIVFTKILIPSFLISHFL